MNTTSLQVKSNSTLATYAANEHQIMVAAIAESKPLSECDLEEIIKNLEREWKLTSATIGHKFDVTAFQLIAPESAKNIRLEFKHLRLDELNLMGSKGRALKFGEFTHVSPLLFIQWIREYMALDERFEAHREAIKPNIPKEPELTQEQHDERNLEALRSELHNPSKHNQHTAGMKARLMDFCVRKKFVAITPDYIKKAKNSIEAILKTQSLRTMSNISGEEKVKREASQRLLEASIFDRKMLADFKASKIDQEVFNIAATDAKSDLFDLYRDEISEKIYSIYSRK